MSKSISDKKIPINSYNFPLQVNSRLHYFLHAASLLQEYSSYTSHTQSYSFLGKKVLLAYEDRKGEKGKGRGNNKNSLGKKLSKAVWQVLKGLGFLFCFGFFFFFNSNFLVADSQIIWSLIFFPLPRKAIQKCFLLTGYLPFVVLHISVHFIQGAITFQIKLLLFF